MKLRTMKTILFSAALVAPIGMLVLKSPPKAGPPAKSPQCDEERSIKRLMKGGTTWWVASLALQVECQDLARCEASHRAARGADAPCDEAVAQEPGGGAESRR